PELRTQQAGGGKAVGKRGKLLQQPRQVAVVGVEERNPGAARLMDAAVARRRRSGVVLPYEPYPRMCPNQPGDLRRTVVGRADVDDDDFRRPKRLRQGGRERALNVRPLVEQGDDHGAIKSEARRRARRSSAGWQFLRHWRKLPCGCLS